MNRRMFMVGYLGGQIQRDLRKGMRPELEKCPLLVARDCRWTPKKGKTNFACIIIYLCNENTFKLFENT